MYRSNFLKTVSILTLSALPLMAGTVQAQDLPNPVPIENTQGTLDSMPAETAPATAEEGALTSTLDNRAASTPKSMPIEVKAEQQSPNPGLNDLLPLLFLKDEYQLLQEAKAISHTRPPLPGELEQSTGQEGVAMGPRELSLAGIVYRSSKDWTIWFNEQRITPTAIPEEVLDLRVGKDFIEIKWYDAYTNQIFPIRLRPHQRFNLDSRIFLPG